MKQTIEFFVSDEFGLDSTTNNLFNETFLLGVWLCVCVSVCMTEYVCVVSVNQT